MSDTDLTAAWRNGDVEALKRLGCTVGGSAGLETPLEPATGTPEATKRLLRGFPCQFIRIDVPFPPMLNNLYFNTPRGRAKSKRGKQYANDVALLCIEKDIHHVTGRLKVEMWVHPPDLRKRDLDGVPKAILDSLVEAGVFEDDSQIDHLLLHRMPPTQLGKTWAYVAVKIEGIAAHPLDDGQKGE